MRKRNIGILIVLTSVFFGAFLAALFSQDISFAGISELAIPSVRIWLFVSALLIGCLTSVTIVIRKKMFKKNSRDDVPASPPAPDHDRESPSGIESPNYKHFSARLTILSEVTNELSKAESLDRLTRLVVELGKDRIGLDRISLWFLSADATRMRGTYGVDANGMITDERNAEYPISPDSRIRPVLRGEKFIDTYDDAPLYSMGETVGRGMRVTAGLWDGEKILGFLSMDNLLHGKPFTVEDREILRLFAFSVGHLSSLKKATEENAKLMDQLAQVQKMESVGRLAGGVAHDFNNMLSVIIGLSELGLSDLDESGKISTYLHEIHRAAKRSAQLTSQLLAFARKQIAAPKPINLNLLIENSRRMFHRFLREEIALRFELDENLWNVLFDPVQLDQILSNLLVNARDAIKGGGDVLIATCNRTLDAEFCARFPGHEPGEYVLLTIRDNGAGMDTHTLDHIFEPFFTTKEQGRGTGLGLAIVYGIVKQNRGIIYAESEPGTGTTVHMYIPRSCQTAETVTLALTENDENRTGTILLVEDEPMVSNVNEIYLGKQGYTILSAGNPPDAIRIALEHAGSIDLLLTDVIMPGMNGRELAERLAIICPKLKSLFISGYASDILTAAGIDGNSVSFLQKPYSMKELGARVRKILDTP